jgi:hypothetical protein
VLGCLQCTPLAGVRDAGRDAWLDRPRVQAAAAKLMAWIESHQSLGHHPKTLRLAHELRCNVPCAVGYLHFFWWWAVDYAPDGVVSAADQAVIARACMWSKKSEQFWAALLSAGFVEHSECGLRIHDWMDYAGKLAEQRALRKESNRKAQAKRRQQKVSADSALTSAHSKRLVSSDKNLRQQSTGPTNQPTGDAAAAVNSPAVSRTRARGETGFEPISALVEEQRLQRRQFEDLPEEVRERLARPPIHAHD